MRIKFLQVLNTEQVKVSAGDTPLSANSAATKSNVDCPPEASQPTVESKAASPNNNTPVSATQTGNELVPFLRPAQEYHEAGLIRIAVSELCGVRIRSTPCSQNSSIGNLDQYTIRLPIASLFNDSFYNGSRINLVLYASPTQTDFCNGTGRGRFQNPFSAVEIVGVLPCKDGNDVLFSFLQPIETFVTEVLGLWERSNTPIETIILSNVYRWKVKECKPEKFDSGAGSEQNYNRGVLDIGLDLGGIGPRFKDVHEFELKPEHSKKDKSSSTSTSRERPSSSTSSSQSSSAASASSHSHSHKKKKHSKRQ